MAMLAADARTIFVGQAVKYPGQRAFGTFADVPMEKRIEMPVAEDFQLGFCTGLAMQGYIPISFFPRWDFLIIAANQLLNHLDKLNQMGGWDAKVIIRTAVGSRRPLNPGPQHTQDYYFPMQLMLHDMRLIEIWQPEEVFKSYEYALECPESCIVVERMSQYEVEMK